MEGQPTAEPEPRVLVGEVVVNGAGDLEDRVFQVITTRPGRATTRSQLQEDVNAIFATGYFSSVDVVPEVYRVEQLEIIGREVLPAVADL